MKKPVLIIGIGNELRGDDAAGIAAVRKLKSKGVNNAHIIENDGDGASLIDIWHGYDNLIIIDALSAGLEPGKIHIFDAGNQKLPKEALTHSSHLFGVSDAIETARALNKLPEKITIYGIEGKTFELGTALSDEVNKAIDEAVKQIKSEISN
jgi:hydrogenase maturation protease